MFGGRSYCKPCKNAAEKARRDKDPEARNAKERQYYAKKKDLVENLVIDQTGSKTCSECKIDKPMTEFYVHSAKGIVRAECKDCATVNRKGHYQKNRTRVIAQTTAYKTQKIKDNPTFCLEQRIRYKTYTALSGKPGAKPVKYLDCTPEFFREWIISQFDDTMNMGNYGKAWHIDHVKPVSSYDLTNDTQLNECFNWKNCRPLASAKNLAKSKVSQEEIDKHKEQADNFFKQWSEARSEKASAQSIKDPALG